MKIFFFRIEDRTKIVEYLFFAKQPKVNFDNPQSLKAKWEGLLKPGEGEPKKTENSKYQLDKCLE